MPAERLQKIVAQSGLASRRRAEELISAGKVRVNGRVVRELGTKADPRKDRIEVDGKRLVRERLVYFLLHKPVGTMTTLEDPEGRRTVMDLLEDVPERVFPVGRLDYNTSGALLLTNDGELAQALAHPSSRAPRTYRVRVDGAVALEELEALRRGVRLEDGPARAADVFVLSEADRSTTVQLTIHEGRNHQIHRMVDAVGHRVLRLARVSFAGLELGELRPGRYRRLTTREIARLKRDYRRGHRVRARAQARRGDRDTKAAKPPRRQDGAARGARAARSGGEPSRRDREQGSASSSSSGRPRGKPPRGGRSSGAGSGASPAPEAGKARGPRRPRRTGG